MAAGGPRRRWSRWLTFAAGLVGATGTAIRDDETVILFPTAARFDPADDVWVVPLHGWVFEAEADSLWRSGLARVVAAALGLDDRALANGHFRERGWMFLVDNERGKTLQLRVGGRVGGIGPSGANGHLSGTVRIAPDDLAGIDGDGWVPVEVILPAGDTRSFRGAVQLLAPEGLTVISDIDDTIKISDVTDRAALLANTFLREFRAVPGMACLYRRWAEAGAAFHYVSSSPWQLYPALSAFLDREGYPRGAVRLRQFRLKDESFFSLFQESDAYKSPEIAAIVGGYPGRRFVLVGDSGERDPEIYGEIARRFPDRIARILIRDVAGADGLDTRLKAAFHGLPDDLWAGFRDAGDIVD